MTTKSQNPIRELWKWENHVRRWYRYVYGLPKKYTCQECRGRGEILIDVIENGRGPMQDCGFCLGTGWVDGRTRGLWLRLQRDDQVTIK